MYHKMKHLEKKIHNDQQLHYYNKETLRDIYSGVRDSIETGYGICKWCWQYFVLSDLLLVCFLYHLMALLLIY